MIRWHREAFRLFWKLKSHRKRQGRPALQKEIRNLIRRMSAENPLWGAPRMHGELLKLGYTVVQSSVAKYMVKPSKPPSQTWKTFLENHANSMVAMDFFTTPTLLFKVLHVLILMDHQRRRIIPFNITFNPTAAWVAQQVREAFPWDTTPRFLLHDRDPLFMANQSLLKSMGVETIITAPGSPWQNAFCERVIGSIRRDALDHVIVLNEEHAQGSLTSFPESRIFKEPIRNEVPATLAPVGKETPSGNQLPHPVPSILVEENVFVQRNRFLGSLRDASKRDG